MKGLFDAMAEDYYGHICALNIVIMLVRTMSAMLLQPLIPGVQNLAAEAPIRDAKEESSLHSDPTSYDAVMVTINSGITGLRFTPALILI
jgi:hypothetical protein